VALQRKESLAANLPIHVSSDAEMMETGQSTAPLTG
jgi:hypothetical protein